MPPRRLKRKEKTTLVASKEETQSSETETKIAVVEDETREALKPKKIDILTKDFIKSAKTSADLAKRLKEINEKLKLLKAKQEVNSVRSIASSLMEEKIMDNKDRHIRLLAACCLVDILRICAPEVPFNNCDLYDIFKLLINQIRELGQSSSGDTHFIRYFYILESLASVKSCILLVGLENDEAIHEMLDEDDEELLVQLFNSLFMSIREDHSVKVEAHMISIMQACIEESCEISQPLLDSILINLLPSHRSAGNTRPYSMAQQVIERTADHMQRQLSQFFNGSLADGNPEHSKSEVSEHVHTLIYEIHKIRPTLLLHVLPYVCMQLQVDDLSTRQEAVALMGRLFSSSHADYGSQYIKNFREFVGRFRDRSKEIRLQMVQVGSIILQRKSELKDVLVDALNGRLSDPEWEIRRRTVNELCDIAAADLNLISIKCLREIGERMKDKKILIRKEAMTGLSQVYSEHMNTYYINDKEVDPTTMQKLSWIPDYVLKCFAYPEETLKVRVIQLLDDIMLPKQSNEAIRMKALVQMYNNFDNSSKEAFRRIIAERQRCQSRVSLYLQTRKEVGKPSDRSNEQKTRLNVCLVSVSELIPHVDGSKKLIEQLDSMKDMKIFKYLEILSSCTVSHIAMKQARDALVKAVGSKSRLGEALKILSRKLIMATIKKESIPELLSLVEQLKNNKSALSILEVMSEFFPGAFLEAAKHFIVLIENSNYEISLTGFRILSNIGKAIGNSKELVDKDVKALLTSRCLSGKQDHAKYSSHCFLMIYSLQDTKNLVKQLNSKFKVENEHIESILRSLIVVSKHKGDSMIDISKDMASKLFEFFLIPKDSLDGAASKGRNRKHSLAGARECMIKCLAMKLLVNILLHVLLNEAGKDLGNRFIQLLYKILREDGRIWTSNDKHAVVYRKTAALCLLKIIRQPNYERLITVLQWHILGYVFQDTDVTVRETFLRVLRKNLMKYSLNHKYSSYLCLAAIESDQRIKKDSKTVLKGVIHRMRQLHEVCGSSSSQNSSDSRDNNEDQTKKMMSMVPEYLLPYVIHLVVHHPDCPPSKHDIGWASHLQYLHFMLDALVSPIASEADNISFLLQILERMNGCFDNAEESDSEVIYDIIEASVEMLRKKIKNQHNLKPYPGRILLPTQLYRPGRVVKRKPQLLIDTTLMASSKGKPRKSPTSSSSTKSTSSSSGSLSSPTGRKLKKTSKSPKEKKRKSVTPTRIMPKRRSRSSKSMVEVSEDEQLENGNDADADMSDSSSRDSEISPILPKKSNSQDSDSQTVPHKRRSQRINTKNNEDSANSRQESLSENEENTITSFRPKRRRSNPNKS